MKVMKRKAEVYGIHLDVRDRGDSEQFATRYLQLLLARHFFNLLLHDASDGLCNSHVTFGNLNRGT